MNEVAELLGHIRRGNAAAAAQVLAASPDLANARDDKGDSPVLVATYHGKQDLVRLLDAWKERFPALRLTCIGKITPEPGLRIRDKTGVQPLTAHGYVHFQES